MDWNQILNWKLLKGSHKFPGPDGGTCINEAAIIAAGFEYREVSGTEHCPPCFSRVVARYALQLNDAMDDELRQELLMPYVVRLAGTADTQEIEVARAQHIALETIRRTLPIALQGVGFKECAARCAEAKDLRGATAAANEAAAETYAAAKTAHAAYATYVAKANAAAKAYAAANEASAEAYAAARTAEAAKAAHAAYVAKAAEAAAAGAGATAKAAADAAKAAASAYAANAYAAHREIFTIAVAILDEAICLGKQADPIEIGIVTERMEAARQRSKLTTVTEKCVSD